MLLGPAICHLKIFHLNTDRGGSESAGGGRGGGWPFKNPSKNAMKLT